MTRLPVRFLVGEREILTVSEAGPADGASLLTHARQAARESEFLNAGPGERALTPEAAVAFLRRLQINSAGFVSRARSAAGWSPSCPWCGQPSPACAAGPSSDPRSGPHIGAMESDAT